MEEIKLCNLKLSCSDGEEEKFRKWVHGLIKDIKQQAKENNFKIREIWAERGDQ